MGVSASGKTAVGEHRAERLDVRFVDADALHPEANIAKMAAGVPLTDDDRWPWLRALRDELATHDSIVVACSALMRSYRDVLRQAGGVSFVFLDADRETVHERIDTRPGHFMKADMVASQFAALQPPGADERDVLTIDAARPVDEVVAALLERFDGD